MKRLYIGGLGHTITQKDLKDRFGKFGNVHDVELVTRKDDAGVPFKTFGYINLEISDVDFKRCLTVLNNSKWKGGTLQIEAARESFLQRLNQERHEASEQKMEAPPVDQKQRMIESLREAGVEGFHMKAAVPGTEVPGHKDWVVSKFGRVLPILNLKSRGRNKTVKCDPSKHSHNIKRLDGSVDTADLVSVSQLTWELQGGDDDISRKRRGEFPPQKPRPKKARAETSICAAAQSNSSTEKTPVSNGKTRPADTRTQTPGPNTAPRRPKGVCVFDSDEEVRMQAAQHQTSQSALVPEEEMDDLEVVGDDYGDDYSRKQQSRGRVPTCPALMNKEDEEEEEDYDSADTDEILASHKTPVCVPVERHPSGLNSEGRSPHTAPSNPGSSGGEKQQRPVSLSAVDTSKARNKTPVPKAKPPSPSESVSSEEAEEEEEDDSEDEYEAMFSNCVRLEVSLSDLQLLAEEARLSDRQDPGQSPPPPPPPPSHSAKKGTTPEEILASIMGDDSSGDECSGNRQKKKKKKRKTKEGLSTALPAFQGTKALMEELRKAGAGLKRHNQEEEERVGGSGKEEEERAGGSCKKHKAAVTSPRHGGNASSESSEEEEEEEEEIIAPTALLPQVSKQPLKTPVCTVASSSSSDSSSSADEEEMITPTALAPTVTKQTPICTAASSSSSDCSSSAEEEEEEEMAPKMTKQPSSSSSSDSSSSEEEEEAFVITNTGEGYPLQEVAKLSAPSSSSDEESEEEEVSPDKELKRKDKLVSKAPSSSSSEEEEEEEEEAAAAVVSVSSRKPPSAVGMLDSHRQQQDNQRRLAAMEQRHREAESQRKLIQGALSERDASAPSTGKSKHIVFGSDEEAEDDFTQTPTPRKVLFQDSQSEGEESHSKMASTNQKAAIKEKNTRKLFENSDDEEEAGEADEDEQRFQLKPQFEGQSGQKLMKLQSRFGTDRRFQMDSRFLESDGEEEEEEGEREEGPEKAKEGEEELEEEKKRSLDILQSMLNIQPSDAKPASKGKAFRDVSALHYDPSKEEHAAFETKTEEKKKESKQERRKKREEAVKLPEVSKEIFYNVSVDLKSVFGPAEEQSVPEEKTATPWDEEEGDEEGRRGVVEQASLPSFLSADSGAVTQQPTGGFSFSFFGDDSATGSAVEKDQYKVETLRGPKVSWQAEPRFQDSSSEEEEQEEQQEEEEQEEQQEEQQEEGKKPAEKLTPQRKAFFFYLEDDERLREGPGLFCRTSTLDDQRGDWQERRPALIQEYRKKHKDAKRKLRGSNRK